MKKYIVGYLNFFDNELRVYKIEANNEIESIAIARLLYNNIIINDENIQNELKYYPDNIDNLYEIASSGEWAFDIIEDV